MKIIELLQDGDVLSTGEVLVSTLARRLRRRVDAVHHWCRKGIAPRPGQKRVYLKCVYYGREIRTRPEWYQAFFDATQRRR